tara:strand:- start:396 stop:602 length:207 start_codon:yes stop_codon:yes gene_type:complete
MINIKYKGYNIEIMGAVAPITTVRAYSNTDDNKWIFKNHNPKDLLYHVFINKVKRTINDRLRYLAQMN